MNLSLSKNEQIVVCVLIFIVIAVAGVFLFILPEYNKIGPNRATLAEKRAEVEQLSEEFSLEKFTAIEQSIIRAYEDGRDASNAFYETEFVHFEADRLIQGILRDMNLITDNIEVSALTTHGLTASIFRTTDIVYDIKSKAIIGAAVVEDSTAPTPEGEGEAPAEGEEAAAPPPVAAVDTAGMPEMAKPLVGTSREYALDWFDSEMEKARMGQLENGVTALDIVEAMRWYLSTESETVVAQSVKFEMPMTSAEATMFTMGIYNLPQASYILGMTWEEIEDEAVIGEDGSEVSMLTAGTKRMWEIDLLFFVVQPMDEPNFEYRDKFNW